MSQHKPARSLGVEVILGRRDAVKASILLAFGMALGKLDALKADGGLLTVDLNQWSRIRFKLGKEQIDISVREAFEALRG